MKKLVIFDLDGTLLNTIGDLAQSTNYALKQCGFPIHNTDSYRTFVGNGINKLFERSLPEEKRNEENIMKVRSFFLPYYNLHKSDLTQPYKGVTELLTALQERGCMIAVASNKYQAATEKLARSYFPGINFIKVLGQREGIPTKPDPHIINEIIQAAGVSKEETIYVGDSNVDIITGHNAGVDVVGVSWGFRSRRELQENNPLTIIEEAEEILLLL